jgi:proton-translocating NADH-quinone oxidoreductase chain M
MILSSIFLILIISIIVISVIDKQDVNRIRNISFLTSCLIFLLSCFLVINFDSNCPYFQHLVNYSLNIDLFNFYLSFALDGVSLFFFSLSCLLLLLTILFVWEEPKIQEYCVILLLLLLLLLLVFSTLDLLVFYISFEAILIPMYLMIGIWGSRERKIRAIYLFFFYTLVGSLCMLLGILYLYFKFGTLNFEFLISSKLEFREQYWLWLAFFLSFSSKIPLFPFHIWLPEAHVEAPTVGSVLLAGILLKLGVYGFLRYSICLFPDASIFFSPLVYLLSVLGIIYASMNAVRQTDLKRIIAYSSVAHMNLITLGIFSFNIFGLEGSILQSLSHGFVSGGMFFLIGILYNRYHSRSLFYYGGLAHMMPIFAIFFLIFTLANIALPGTSSFVGEFLILLGIYKINFFISLFATLGVILCGGYSLWLCNRILFGNLKTNYTLIFKDLEFREFSILLPLLLLILLTGVYPGIFLNSIHASINNLFLITLS